VPDVVLLLGSVGDAGPLVGVGAGAASVFALAIAFLRANGGQHKVWQQIIAEQKRERDAEAKRRNELEIENEGLVTKCRECEQRASVAQQFADAESHRAELAEERAARAEERATMLTLQMTELARKVAHPEEP
jgi:hypothetical protein